MNKELLDICWDSLCLLRKQIFQYHTEIIYCCFQFSEQPDAAINSKPKNNSKNYIFVYFENTSQNSHQNPSIIVSNILQIKWLYTGNLPSEVLNFIELCIPYCFLAIHAKKQKRSFTIGHFAQSLDGCIATYSGDSKWIGNQENLIHAHRMRALCDAVLVGKNTLLNDNPKLTVRHVPGDTPIRIILGDGDLDFSSLLIANDSKIIHVTHQAYTSKSKNIEVVVVPKENGFILLDTLLEELYKMGIYSIYVEGGAKTTSIFLQENLLDILQIHIAPLIIGNGIRLNHLQNIEYIHEAKNFEYHKFFYIGDSIMFIGKI